jgi:hypothetical protein
MEWETHKKPLGNNGRHSVAVTSQIEFEEWVVGDGWTNEYPCGPAATSVTTENLWISSCTASNGTIDYFKYDPYGDTALAHPHLQFTISDADPHKYCCIIRFRETAVAGTWSEGEWSSMRVDLEDDRTADIDLTQPGEDGKCLNDSDHKWGTYTYDLVVIEYEGDQPKWEQSGPDGGIDWNFLKRYRYGYKLWVPEYLPPPDSDVPGHDMWFNMLEEVEKDIRAYYCLHSEFEGLDADSVDLITIDPSLSEVASVSGPVVTGCAHGFDDADEDGRIDGILCYEFGAGGGGGDWRVITTARDAGGRYSPDWRSHTSVPMLAANKVRPAYEIVYIEGSFHGTDWLGAWCKPAASMKTVYLTPNLRTVQSYVDRGLEPQVDMYEFTAAKYLPYRYKIRAGVNGGFFYGLNPIGRVGQGVGSWPGMDVDKRRWGFAFQGKQSATNAIIRQDVAAGKGLYTASPQLVGGRPYGISAVGCLISGGQPQAGGAEENYPHPGTKDARTCVAWSAGGSFFLIVCKGDDRVNHGWTWSDMQEFLLDQDDPAALPRAFQAQVMGYSFPPPLSSWVGRPSIRGAMALDGGGSTQFRFVIVAPSDVAAEHHEYDAGPPGGDLTTRAVPDLVLGSVRRTWAGGVLHDN